jgi:uncharacterized membrane protein
MTQQEWSKTTSAIFNGVLIFSLSGIVNAILSPIETAVSGVSALQSMSGGGGSGGNFLSIIVDWIIPIAIIAGYIMYLIGLKDFKNLLAENDSAAAGKIFNGVILSLIGTALAWIPAIGWIIGGIVGLIGFIVAMMGYSGLKNSASFPETARNGASKLYTAQILLIIGWLIGLIPFVGGIIKAILALVAFILVLSGWAKIKNTQVQTV